MKKLLRYGDCLVLLAGIIGCLLRLWFQNTGVDVGGLYQSGHPAWILLCLFSAAVVVFLWFLCRSAGDNRRYDDNFKRSTVSAGSYLLMAIVLGYFSITDLISADGFLEVITALAGMATGVMLAVTGVERFSGNRPVFFLHLVPCVYFTLRMLLLGRDFGTEPELCTFLFRFAASVTMIPAFYWLWAFDVNMANRKQSLFFSLTAAFFCLVTTFESSTEWVLYLTFAAFFLSNLCRLQYLAQPEEETEEATEEAIPANAPEADEPVEAPISAEDTEEITPPPSAEENIAAVAAQSPVIFEAEEACVPLTSAPEAEISEREAEPIVSEPVEAPVIPTPVEEPVAVPELQPIPFPDIDALPDASRRTVAASQAADEEVDVFRIPPTIPRPGKQNVPDPDMDWDAFLQEIKLFLDDENF